MLSPLSVGIVAVALAATVVAVYSPTLNFKFILDDHRYVGDPRVQSPGHVWEYFTTYVWAQFTGGPTSFYRPLFVLWMRLNFILSGESPWGWHLLSVVKHVSVAVLLGLLVWKLLRDRVAALLAAALFVLHPAQTESVAWISVPDSLMSIAILGSVLLYLHYIQIQNIQRESASGQTQTASSRRKSRKQAQGQSQARIVCGLALRLCGSLPGSDDGERNSDRLACHHLRRSADAPVDNRRRRCSRQTRHTDSG